MIELREYQVDAIVAVYDQFRQGNRRVLLQMPTGAGKTTVFCKIVQDFRLKRPESQVICLAHRVELIDQMHKRLGLMGIPNWPSYAAAKNPEYPVHSTSVQKLAHPKFDAWPPSVGLIVVDEAPHVSAGNSYEKVLSRYPEAFVFGVTATPCRLDGKGLDAHFESLVLGPTVRQLIDEGHLSDYDYYCGSSASTDKMRSRGGDYRPGDIEREFDRQELRGDLVRNYQEYASGKRCIVFGSTVAHSRHIVEAYQAEGIQAEHLDGTTPKAQRRAILDRFRSGQTLILSNVGIVTEGFDVPACEAVQLARPTKSLSLYLQMVGRCLRPAEGKRAIILDHGNCVEEHGLPCDNRQWTLQGAPKRQQYEIIKDEEGKVVEVKDKPIQDELVDLGDGTMLAKYDRSMESRILRIVAQQQERGYKRSWAYYRFVERHGHEMDLGHLKLLAKNLGYHWRWATHKWEEFISLMQEAEAPW